METKWNYVKKDGNPTEPGIYWVTVIWDEWKDRKPTGKKIATVTTRYFADLDKEPDLIEWAMQDQPRKGLVWTEECGSGSNESVLAWMPYPEIPIAKLPDGVIEAD